MTRVHPRVEGSVVVVAVSLALFCGMTGVWRTTEAVVDAGGLVVGIVPLRRQLRAAGRIRGR